MSAQSTRANRIPRIPARPMPTAPGLLRRMYRALSHALQCARLWHAERQVAHLAEQIEALEAAIHVDELILAAHTLPRICADALERRAADDDHALDALYLRHACATLRLRALQG